MMKHRFTLKAVSVMLAAVLACSCAMPAFAADENGITFGSLGLQGLSVVHLDSSGNVIESGKSGDSPDSAEDYDLPSSFDSRDEGLVTSPEKQYYGDCWAYSVMSTLESSALAQGYGEQHFSKSHLTAFALNPVSDGARASDVWNAGGNSFIATFTLADLEGIASEAEFPNKTDDSCTISGSDRFDHSSGFVLDESRWLTSVNEVKKSIMENGAVSADYYNNSVKDEMHRYNGMYCIWNGSSSYSNHQIAIIGWDDSIPASAFRNGGRTPSQDGAWIIKNSWFGSDDDYMYLSYSQNIESFCSMTVRDDTNLLRSYTHAERGYSTYITAPTADYADVFTAQGNERISSVGVFIDTNEEITEVTTTVNIYKNLPSSYSSPDNGTLVCTCSSTCTADGFYTIDIPGEVTLSAGEIYAVEIKSVDSGGAYVYVPVEKNYRYQSRINGTSSYSYSGAEKQSYVKAGEEYDFIDIYAYYHRSLGVGNCFMQVYTSCNHTPENGVCTNCGKALTACSTHTAGYSAVTTPATKTSEGVRTLYCADCGEECGTEVIPTLQTPSVKIVNNPGTKSVKYGVTLELSAVTENLPEGSVISWYIDGECQNAYSGKVDIECKGSCKIEVKVEDVNGNVITDDGAEIADSESIEVQFSIFRMIITFFRDLFGLWDLEVQ